MKTNTVLKLIACCGGATLLSAVAHGQTFVIGSDVRPRVESSRIITDAFDDDTGQLVPNVEFFGYEFQEDPLDPYFIEDPGFSAVAGSGLPPGSALSFNVVRHLAYWNGAGNVSFTTPPNQERLRFSFGAASVTISNSTGPQSGFSLGNVGAGGTLHRHLNAFLLGSDSATDPTDGIYFTNIRLVSSDGSITPSDSLYLVYNNGASEPAFESALSYLANPLPGEANFDGIVNLADFNILAANFGASDRFWYQGDFNRDRVVNLADFNLLASRFGQSNSAAGTIPEPTLALPLIVLILARPRRIRFRARELPFTTYSSKIQP